MDQSHSVKREQESGNSWGCHWRRPVPVDLRFSTTTGLKVGGHLRVVQDWLVWVPRTRKAACSPDRAAEAATACKLVIQVNSQQYSLWSFLEPSQCQQLQRSWGWGSTMEKWWEISNYSIIWGFKAGWKLVLQISSLCANKRVEIFKLFSFNLKSVGWQFITHQLHHKKQSSFINMLHIPN